LSVGLTSTKTPLILNEPPCLSSFLNRISWLSFHSSLALMIVALSTSTLSNLIVTPFRIDCGDIYILFNYPRE
jgi:hypothetical protein